MHTYRSVTELIPKLMVSGRVVPLGDGSRNEGFLEVSGMVASDSYYSILEEIADLVFRTLVQHEIVTSCRLQSTEGVSSQVAEQPSCPIRGHDLIPTILLMFTVTSPILC